MGATYGALRAGQSYFTVGLESHLRPTYIPPFIGANQSGLGYDYWSAVSNVSWITNLTPHSPDPAGQGDPMDWVVQPNTAATRRTGTITVSYRSNPAYSYFPAPDIVTVSQNGLPSYTFTPATITLTSVAQSVGTPMLIDNSQVSQADFVFRSTDSWITVPRGPQRPFGDWIAPPVVSPLTVPFSVSVNTGPDRTGTITVYDSNETSPAILAGLVSLES